MIKVASSAPSNPQQTANGFLPAPPSAAPAPLPMVFSNPVATAELPEVNEPEKPPPEGEAKLVSVGLDLGQCLRFRSCLGGGGGWGWG